MGHAAIVGTGLYTPENSISNEELVSSFNATLTRTTRRMPRPSRRVVMFR